MAPKQTKISKADIESVAGKLEGFVAELPEQERDVLGWILTRAQAAPAAEFTAAAAKASPEVGGLKSPLAKQLARSVGLTGAKGPDITVVVGWTYRFGKLKPGTLVSQPALKATAVKKTALKKTAGKKPAAKKPAAKAPRKK